MSSSVCMCVFAQIYSGVFMHVLYVWAASAPACVCTRGQIYAYLPAVLSELSAEVNKPMHTCVNTRYEPDLHV